MDNIRIYCEWNTYDNDDEKAMLINYLSLWKIFFLKKYKCSLEYLEEQIVERPPWGTSGVDMLLQQGSIAIKLKCRMKMDPIPLLDATLRQD